MADKIQIIDPKTTYVDEQAEIGEGTTIYPNTTILGKTVIGKNCEIGPNSVIQDSKICLVKEWIEKAEEELRGAIGMAFSYLRETGITEKDLMELVERKLSEAKKR